MSKSKSKSKSPEQGGEEKTCVHFKPQHAAHKRLGCVQPAPCAQCPDCAYIAPKK